MSQCHDEYEAEPDFAHLPVRVEDVMTTKAVTVAPTAGVKEIAQILLDHDIRSVPVVDLGDELVGVVSEADIICRECPSVSHHSLKVFAARLLGTDHGWERRAEGLTAGEIMSTEVVTCSPRDSVALAAERMLSNNVRMIPVVERGQLVGVLSRHDVLKMFDRPDFWVRARVNKLLADVLWAPEGHSVTAHVIDGVVRLTGSVRYPSDAGVIVSIVSEVPGVVEVIDRMTADYPEPKPSLLRDTDWR